MQNPDFLILKWAKNLVSAYRFVEKVIEPYIERVKDEHDIPLRPLRLLFHNITLLFFGGFFWPSVTKFCTRHISQVGRDVALGTIARFVGMLH